MSSAAKAAAADHGRQELVKYFAGSGLAAREESLSADIVEQAAGDVRFLDAGVKDLTVTSVVIDGDHATVTASATVWLDVAQVQADGTQVVAHPQNAKLYTLSLERMAGRWYVVDEFSKFAPGSEP